MAKEIEMIEKMVIHGLYKVCLVEGYSQGVFLKLKEEQKRLFDNYVRNKNRIEEMDSAQQEYEKAINELIESGKAVTILNSDKAKHLQGPTEDITKTLSQSEK